MCLAIIAMNVHPDWPLIVAANRDEFHARPTQAMQPWPESTTVLAGRDLLAGGTWLGLTAQGKFALLTNVRDPAHHRHQAPSRGALVQRYLQDSTAATTYLDALAPDAHAYNGFNLIVAEPNGQLWHACNGQTPFYRTIAPGVHGISNASLDTPWPKTVRTTQALEQYLLETSPARTPEVDRLLGIMLDEQPAPDELLPSTGISLARERLLGRPFIVSEDYGTRCITLVLRHRSGYQWVQEDTFNPQGRRTGRVRYSSLPTSHWRATDAGPGNLNTD